MKNVILFLCCLSVLSGRSQLPENWVGHYVGELKAESVTGASVTYHMELIVSFVEGSAYDWIIIYGEDSLRQERQYLLEQKGENQYVINEMNSIVLSCNRFGNSLVSLFEVQNNLIHAVYRFEKNKVIFELTSSSNKTATGNTSNDQSPNLKDIPIVYTYATSNFQKATLKRVK